MKRLENKVALITGGNSGIGLSTAILFALNGAKVAITGRDRETLTQAAQSIGNGAISFVSDVTDVSGISKTYEEVVEKLGKIDVLVVNAGIAIAGLLADYTEQQFDQVSDINFKGAFFSVQRALPYLNDSSSIILSSSATNEKGFPGYAAYAATKAAVRSLARSFSTDLAERKIRVNVLSAGPIDTPFLSRGGASKEEVENAKQLYAGMVPAKRLGNSSEIAEGFLFLASDASAYMLGSELVMDGGIKTL